MLLTPVADIAEVLGARVAGIADGVVATGVSTDSRTLRAGDVFFAISGPNFDGQAFVREAVGRGARACVVRADFAEPVAAPVLRVGDVQAALRALASWHRRRAAARVIAVTGSNGKTTTKNMLAHVLGAKWRCRASPKSFNNHVGVPLTLLSCAADDVFVVVEIGSNAPGEVAALARIAEPDAGLVTSIGHAHLEGLGGIEGVYREKMSLFDHVRAGGVALVDAAAVSGRGTLPRAGELRWITFGDHPEADVRVSDIGGDLQHTFAALDERHLLRLGVPGAHNAVNACGVFALCRRLGMSAEEIVRILATFEMPELRLNVRRLGPVTVIDDCYNANPTSMRAALDVLSRAGGERRVLVAGAMAELGEGSLQWHRAVGEAARQAGVELVVAIGEAAQPIVEAAGAGDDGLRTVCYADVGEAVVRLPGELRAGDTVLIKGSRSAGLESLAGSIAAAFGAAACVGEEVGQG